MIDESHQWFVDLVVKRRQIQPERIPGFMKGRVFSGRQALQYGLIDAVGGEQTAIDWLVQDKKIDKGLPVIDWHQAQEAQSGLLGLVRGYTRTLLGVSIQSYLDQMTLSGLMSMSPGELFSK